MQELIDAIHDLFKDVGDMTERAEKLSEQGMPPFRKTSEPSIVHPQVFSNEEDANKFAYKKDGRGIAAMAELQAQTAFIVEG